MRTTEELDLPLAVDRGRTGGEGDLRQQVAEQLRRAVRTGAFVAGQRLPSSRLLAAHLRVSRATVTAAVTELEGEGWLESRQGSGTYVATALDGMRLDPGPASVRPVLQDADQAAAVDLAPGRPDTRGLADGAWRRAWRDAVAGPVATEDPPLAGVDELRTAIAAHVRRSRGLGCDPTQVLVTAGTVDALRLVADATGAAGGTAVVEEPGYPTARRVLRRAGVRLHPIPVDTQGMVTDLLDAAPDDARLLYLTPSHQYPVGGLLPVDRRMTALAWAQERDAVVVEDDYDGEFRFGTSPVPALATLDSAGRVAYVGTFSKAVTPGLRLGFVVAPPPLVAAALEVRGDTGTPVAGLVQRAMATYLADGGARRHIARQRRVYAERRARLVRRLEHLPGVVSVQGLDAGLHAVVSLSPDRVAAVVVLACGRAGVRVSDLDEYRMTPLVDEPGVVLGYGHVTASELDRGIDVLAGALA